MTDQFSPESKKAGHWIRRNFVSILMFVGVTGITIFLFSIQDKLKGLGNAGYLGVFVISLAANATIVLPIPTLIVVLPLATVLNPFYLGVVAGVGGAIGELTAYVAGFSGRGIWSDNKVYQRAVTWLKKWGIGVVFFISATPLPMDVMGLAAGNLRFPVWKYLIGVIPGKIAKYVVLAYATAWGWDIYVNSAAFRENVLAFGVGVGVAFALLVIAFWLESINWTKQR
jgi:membrane protein YqaA with SNARE-associated domain